ncbi:hypothetical protein DFH09DRAFT_1271401, partial [Mycena vulgaris]
MISSTLSTYAKLRPRFISSRLHSLTEREEPALFPKTVLAMCVPFPCIRFAPMPTMPLAIPAAPTPHSRAFNAIRTRSDVAPHSTRDVQGYARTRGLGDVGMSRCGVGV